MSYGLIVSPWNTSLSSPAHSTAPPFPPATPRTTWHTLPAELQCMILAHAVESAQASRRRNLFVSRHGPTVWEARDVWYATQQPLARVLLVSRASAAQVLPLMRAQEEELRARVERVEDCMRMAERQMRRIGGADVAGSWLGAYEECWLVGLREFKVYKEQLDALKTAGDSVRSRLAGWA